MVEINGSIFITAGTAAYMRKLLQLCKNKIDEGDAVHHVEPQRAFVREAEDEQRGICTVKAGSI